MPRRLRWSPQGEKARCERIRPNTRTSAVDNPHPTKAGECMRRLLRRRSLAGLAAAATICGGLAACSSSPNAGNSKSGEAPTLVMESSPETSITQAFNPFVATQAAYGMGATGLIYEPLIEFNLAKPPQYYTWLATKYAWGDSGKQITFTIRSGVKWSNGKPLTPADVAFTYNMMKKNSAVNLGGLDISSVSTSGNKVTVTFPTAQYTNLQQIAGIAVVPEAIWSKVSNPATFTDANPVGTGPFVLDRFTPQGFTLKRNRAIGRRRSSRSTRFTSRSTRPTRARCPRCTPGRSTGRATSSRACRRTSSIRTVS